MELLKNIAALIKVKTIVTLVVMAVFVVLALRGDISADNAMLIVSMVISFYFGSVAEKKNAKNDEITMALEENDIERLKEIFVPRQECQTTNEEIKTKLANDLVRLAVIENQLKVITWILYAVAGGVITMLIKLLFGS